MSQRRVRPADRYQLGSRTLKQTPHQAPAKTNFTIPVALLGAFVGLIIACVLLPIYFSRGMIVDFSPLLDGSSGTPQAVGYLFDTSAYYSAFARVLEGGSPYLSTTLSGVEAPVSLGSYRYLPPFALLLSPLAFLTRETVDIAFVVLGAVLYSVAVASALKPLRLRTILLAPAIGIVALNFCALTGYASGSVVMLTAPAYLLILDAPARTRLNGVLLAATAFVRLEIGLFLATIGLRERKLLLSAGAAALLIVGVSLLFPVGMQAWQEAPIAFTNIAVGFSQASSEVIDPRNVPPALFMLRSGIPPTIVTMTLVGVAVMGSLLAQRLLQRPNALMVTAALSLLPLPTVWPQVIASLFPLAIAVLVRQGGSRRAVATLIGLISFFAFIVADDRPGPLALAYIPLVFVFAHGVWQQRKMRSVSEHE